MRRYFCFEAKFGWSEVVALVALLFAILAFVDGRRANQPAISVEHFSIGVGPVRDAKSGRQSFVTLIPLVFKNSGGRGATLITFRPAREGVPPVLFVVDGRVVSKGGPRYDFFLSSRMIEDLVEWEAFLPGRGAFDLSTRPPILNVSIPPGESRAVYLGLAADIVDQKVTQLLIAVEAEFGHGERQPIRVAIDVRR